MSLLVLVRLISHQRHDHDVDLGGRKDEREGQGFLSGKSKQRDL